MNNYCFLFNYDSKEFMDINRIIAFKKNLDKVEKQNYNIKMSFFGDASNEELATFMGYFNSLIGKKICDLSISLKTKELVFENGINNKSIKLSAQETKQIKDKKFDSIILEYYKDLKDVEIKILPIKDWEKLILDLIGE